MRIICFFAFILLAVTLGVFAAFHYAASKATEFTEWLMDLCSALLDLLIDKATMPKY